MRRQFLTAETAIVVPRASNCRPWPDSVCYCGRKTRYAPPIRSFVMGQLQLKEFHAGAAYTPHNLSVKSAGSISCRIVPSRAWCRLPWPESGKVFTGRRTVQGGTVGVGCREAGEAQEVLHIDGRSCFSPPGASGTRSACSGACCRVEVPEGRVSLPCNSLTSASGPSCSSQSRRQDPHACPEPGSELIEKDFGMAWLQAIGPFPLYRVYNPPFGCRGGRGSPKKACCSTDAVCFAPPD